MNANKLKELLKILDLAEDLYTTYCQAVGGFSYDNKPLPTWKVFVNDENKHKQVQAWFEAARMVINKDFSDNSRCAHITFSPNQLIVMQHIQEELYKSDRDTYELIFHKFVDKFLKCPAEREDFIDKLIGMGELSDS